MTGGTGMDFYQVRTRKTKYGIEVYPDFIVDASRDLMVRGGSFYAVWNESTGLWSTNEFDVRRLVDEDLHAKATEMAEDPDEKIIVRSMSSFGSKSWTTFRSYVTNMPDSHHTLDSTLSFANTPPRKGDYCSKRLPYSIAEGPMLSYERLMTVLYAPEERRKLEWGIGAILSGESRKLQKFFVLYGEAGTGKSTFLDILQMLFRGYETTFDAKAITGGTNAFATEAFKGNPLVAIQHDGDLSKIADNTRLNSIISHEPIVINEKYKASYSGELNALLFIGTNQSVQITDAKSGLIRRLIDVHPTGDRVPVSEYYALKQGVADELGAIAFHCLALYRRLGRNYYSSYRPMDMILRTDVFYNFLLSNYDMLREQDGVTLKQAWALYKTFCDDGGYDWRLNRSRFRDEMRNYFDKFTERGRVDGVQVWNLFQGFRSDKFGILPPEEPAPSLTLDVRESLLDEMLAGMPAQYANEEEIPEKRWANVRTTLADLDTSRLHFVRPGSHHIVIDFDLREDGKKSPARNLAAASLWPPTYAERSKGGAGIHLHYIYEGDVSELSSIYEEGIEIKTFPGEASLRRKLTRCNDIPVATMSGGLPLKERRVLDSDTMKSEKALRSLILRNLRKEIHPGTKPSVDFIWKILEDAYNSGMSYDVTDMRGVILAFANNSTNQAPYCVKTVMSMKFASDPESKPKKAKDEEQRLAFYDVEVFPNLFVICWKYEGDANVVKMINPTPQQAEEVASLALVGFNNRRFDNHILYARIMGYGESALYDLSQRIISGDQSAMFGDAYDLSHADVYDFSSVKPSLKWFQIELGLNHKELGLPWNEPVDPSLWEQVADYCANDVITTEQVFHARKQDYIARQILSSLSGLRINDTTQRHTARIIFGMERRPQQSFIYTDLSQQFPGYTYSFGKSSYKGEDPGEGGYVYAEPGIYHDVAVLDVASMHPTSIEVLNAFGPYTGKFAALKAARVAIKHRDYERARKMLGGALAPYLDSPDDAKALSDALKIAINIVYGLTSASFENPFRDPRNKDNIVAKRGALFMIDLKQAVQDQGFQVVHIKTDSIKIPGATQEIIEFVVDFGKRYGYEFEHEVTYERFCLANDAVYIARTEKGEWTATGAQFAHPFVFKTLFTGEPLVFEDFCETKTVTTALYLDFGNGPEFVGRAGSFIPVLEGGGTLTREKDGKHYAATGSKGYLWKESVMVKEDFDPSIVDMKYFRRLADEALANIAKHGDPEEFRGK
jgi:Family of unknown function (DUF5906)